MASPEARNAAVNPCIGGLRHGMQHSPLSLLMSRELADQEEQSQCYVAVIGPSSAELPASGEFHDLGMRRSICFPAVSHTSPPRLSSSRDTATGTRRPTAAAVAHVSKGLYSRGGVLAGCCIRWARNALISGLALACFHSHARQFIILLYIRTHPFRRLVGIVGLVCNYAWVISPYV